MMYCTHFIQYCLRPLSPDAVKCFPVINETYKCCKIDFCAFLSNLTGVQGLFTSSSTWQNSYQFLQYLWQQVWCNPLQNNIQHNQHDILFHYYINLLAQPSVPQFCRQIFSICWPNITLVSIILWHILNIIFTVVSSNACKHLSNNIVFTQSFESTESL